MEGLDRFGRGVPGAVGTGDGELLDEALDSMLQAQMEGEHDFEATPTTLATSHPLLHSVLSLSQGLSGWKDDFEESGEAVGGTQGEEEEEMAGFPVDEDEEPFPEEEDDDLEEDQEEEDQEGGASVQGYGGQMSAAVRARIQREMQQMMASASGTTQQVPGIAQPDDEQDEDDSEDLEEDEAEEEEEEEDEEGMGGLVEGYGGQMSAATRARIQREMAQRMKAYSGTPRAVQVPGLAQSGDEDDGDSSEEAEPATLKPTPPGALKKRKRKLVGEKGRESDRKMGDLKSGALKRGRSKAGSSGDAEAQREAQRDMMQGLMAQRMAEFHKSKENDGAQLGVPEGIALHDDDDEEEEEEEEAERGTRKKERKDLEKKTKKTKKTKKREGSKEPRAGQKRKGKGGRR